MSQPSTITYDSVPYPGVALANTHPDALATLGALFGMSPPPVEGCRVLEIGCAIGTNLITMAAALPGSSFVGVDLSATQIELARGRSGALGLANVSFHAMDLRDIGAEFGEFDYIIAYGVFSWVPRAAQEAIFALCRRHLSPSGVALISYNTYPGWHMQGMIREMMLYHSQHFGDAATRIEQARSLLNFLSESTERLSDQMPSLALYAQFLRQEQADLRNRPDYYVAHEYLEDHNEPVYFSQFIERAAKHGLQYLSDVRFSHMLSTNLPQPIAEILDDIAPNAIALEQYIDFLTNRTFRQSLLVRAEVELRRGLSPESIDRFRVASRLSHIEDGAGGARRYQIRDQATTIAVRSPLSIAAVDHLIEVWPQSVAFDDLVIAARQASPPDPSDADTDHVEVLRELIARGVMVDIFELSLSRRPFTLEPGERPVANTFARLQAADSVAVSSLRQEMIELQPIGRLLLPLLDGSRDRAALIDHLARLVAAGELAPIAPELAGLGTAELRPALERLLADTLRTLAYAALLAA